MVGVLPDAQVSVPVVAELPEPPAPELVGQLATVATEETTPEVVSLFGSVMLTPFPTAILVCWEASSATRTWRVVEVPCSTGSPGWAPLPSWAATEVTRTTTGSNTAWPRLKLPVRDTPSAPWSFSTPAVVADPNTADLVRS